MRHEVVGCWRTGAEVGEGCGMRSEEEACCAPSCRGQCTPRGAQRAALSCP